MLDDADRALINWIEGLADAPNVRLATPGSAADHPTIDLYLIDIKHAPPQRSASGSRWQLRLRYLVTAYAPDLLEAHRLLGQILTAAVENEDFEIESEPPPLQLWQTLGIPPRPCLTLLLPWQHAKELPRAPQARELSLQNHPLGPLSGIVVGPGDVMLAAAQVAIPGLGLSTSTDHRGRFFVPGVPLGLDMKLQITARGKVFETSLNEAKDPRGNLVIRVAL